MSKVTTFSEIIKERMAQAANPAHTGGTWHGKSYPHICKELKYNFIDGDVPLYCNLKQPTGGKIHYHQAATHLNSSQVMCISFFKKFFKTADREALLLQILNELTGTGPTKSAIPAGATITAAYFEHEPDHAERTNFDFYLELSSGAHISIEVKFTESDFGKISPCKSDSHKYARKWSNTYVPLLKECACAQDKLLSCKNCEQPIICAEDGLLSDRCTHREGCLVHEFYEHYQIWRNIAYATSPADIVLFLTPRANEALNVERAYIDDLGNQFNGPTIQNMYWEDLILIALKNTTFDSQLHNYLMLFKDKYLLD